MGSAPVLAARFPGALPVPEFLEDSRTALASRGFLPEHTLAGVGLCRDELCASLMHGLQATWGPCFNLGSLAGAVSPGALAFDAFLQHAPSHAGRQRVVCFGFTHVAFDPGGRAGACSRPGLEGSSSACGALVALQRELAAGSGVEDERGHDGEFQQLGRRLRAGIPNECATDLVALTLWAWRSLAADLERDLRRAIGERAVDRAVCTGVQIHLPGGLEHIWTGSRYTVVRSLRSEL